MGRARVTDEGIGFPEPLQLPAGHEPTSMRLIDLDGTPTLAVIATFVNEASAAAALQSSFGDPKPVYWNDLAVNFDGVMVERGARTRRLRRSSVATRTRLTG